MEEQTPTLLTTDQAAKVLRLSPRTLERWRQEGKDELPYIDLGRRVFYELHDIRAFVKARRRRSTSDTGGRR